MAPPPPPPPPPPTLLTPHTLDAIIIGAGLGGVAAAAALLKAGARDVLVLEKGASPGGVWRDADYPGARCDVPSALYSYSPASGLTPPGWTWSQTYGSRDEILGYVRAAAAGAGVAQRVRVRCAVTRAAFEPGTGTWAVAWADRSGAGGPGGGGDGDAANAAADLDFRTDAAGAAARAGDERAAGAPSGGRGPHSLAPPARLFTARARVVFAATGLLGTPAYPMGIAGLLGPDRVFTGPVFHSARWDWAAPLGGKRVVVVGAGASAAQVVPALADPARGLRSLTLCLRSPPTVIAKGNSKLVGWAGRAARARLPGLASRATRAAEWAKAEVRGWAIHGGAAAAGPLGRAAASLAAKGAAAIAAGHRAAALKGAPPSTVAALTPRHPLGCKRVLLSDTFLATLSRTGGGPGTGPAVGVETGTLVSASAAALHLADGRAIPADVVVLCTGYVAPAWLAGVEVVGRGGVSLAQAWKGAGRASAYCGTAVPGFPNFFLLGGPGSGTANHSALAFMEAQIDQAVRALGLLGLWDEEEGGGGGGGGGGGARTTKKKQGKAAAAAAASPSSRPPPGSVVEVRPDVAAAFQDALTTRLGRTAFPHCASWYREAGGAGPVSAVWPGSATSFARVAAKAAGGVYAVVPPPGVGRPIGGGGGRGGGRGGGGAGCCAARRRSREGDG